MHPPAAFLGHEDDVTLVLHSRLQLLDAPVRLEHIVRHDEHKVPRVGHEVNQVTQLLTELCGVIIGVSSGQ